MGIHPMVARREGRERRLDWGRSEGGGRGEGVGGGGLSPYFSSCLKREAGGGGREGGSCHIRVLAAKHLPCSRPTPIHITPVLLHP